MIDATLGFLRAELWPACDDASGYVLFGSTVLYLHGLRDDVGDVDVFVRPDVWNELERRAAWRWHEPTVGDPPLLYSMTAPPVSAFHAWTLRDAWMDVAECFAKSELVRGFRCVPLEVVRHHKREALSAGCVSEKHARDLRVLDYVLS